MVVWFIPAIAGLLSTIGIEWWFSGQTVKETEEIIGTVVASSTVFSDVMVECWFQLTVLAFAVFLAIAMANPRRRG